MTRDEFFDYYTDLSMSVPSDEYFVRMMESTWQCPEDEKTQAIKATVQHLLTEVRARVLELCRNDIKLLKKVFSDFDLTDLVMSQLREDPLADEDIVIVNINPLERDELPIDAHGILNRINEISFNSSLLRELRAIHFVQRLIADGKVSTDAMKKVRVHMIADDDLMTELSVASKLVPTPATLSALFDAGQAAAERFLAEHRSALGKTSSVDLPEMYG